MSIKMAIIVLVLAFAIVGFSSLYFFSHNRISEQGAATSTSILQRPPASQELISGNPLQFAPTSSQEKLLREIFAPIERAAQEDRAARPAAGGASGAIISGGAFGAAASSGAPSGAPSTISSTVSPAAISGKMPNDIETMIADVKKIGAQQGRSADNLVKIENAIRQTAATSTDLMAEFLKIVKAKSLSVFDPGGFVRKVLADLGIVKIVEAGLGVPFGGRVVAVLPCTCVVSAGHIWLIDFKPPLPPTYVTTLSFIVESQLYLSHIPPHPVQSFLGFYKPLPSGLCWVGTGLPCILVPDMGLILPQVGSSP